MVVDLLRPCTGPISSHRMLCFEFLLDEQLLVEHLRRPNPEPSATELIAEFLSDTSNCFLVPDATFTQVFHQSRSQFTRKQLAFKILALKIASSLHWNLDTFETKLTPLVQQQLMQALVFMASDGLFSVPPQEISTHMSSSPQLQFALTLYHRWVLRFPAKTTLEAKSAKQFMQLRNIPLENAYTHTISNNEILMMNKNNRMPSIKYLEKVIAYYNSHVNREPKWIKIPVMETFVHLTEDINEIVHNWDAGSYISQHELLMQIHFDLCYNYFFYGQHEEAKRHILECRNNQKLLECEAQNTSYCRGEHDKESWGKLNYASISENDVSAYIRALNLGQDLLNEDKSLLLRLQESVANGFVDIVTVLKEDNLSRQIPMILRQLVELDIQTATLNGVLLAKDLPIRVSALNAVRYALEGGVPSTLPSFLNKFETVGESFIDTLFWALAPILVSCLSEDDWLKLRIFFLHLTISYQCKLPIVRIEEYLKKHVGGRALEIWAKLICDEHLEVIIKDQIISDDENMYIPRELLEDNWDSDIEYKYGTELDMEQLKQRLMMASSAEDVRMCLVKLATMSPSLPLWKLSPCKPIGNLEYTLSVLPRGFLQDFCTLVSGAARAKMEVGDARAALSLLSVVESETHNRLAAGNEPSLARLCSALAWEVLLLQINLMLSEWPHHRIDVTMLAEKCKAAIATTVNDVDAPRSQVVLAAWLGLLNMGLWEISLDVLEAGFDGSAANMIAALCVACTELQRGKSVRKLPQTLWDHVLHTFNNSIGAQKHYSTHASHHHYYSNYGHDVRPYYLVTQGLRNQLAISIVLSLLAKIYNILVGDSSTELVLEYTNLWPNKITNMKIYNPKDVLEALIELLERSLMFYPYNTAWLRLYGDAKTAVGHHAAALREYLCALAVESQFFTTRVTDEDGLARRAAQCCQALAAPTQAAALCQLTKEPYTRAFKCLTEKIANVADATEAYYGCLWDCTLLEIAIAHAKRGEATRRARAITAIGALELNANNSDEIKREAADLRRARLLRALTEQYVC